MGKILEQRRNGMPPRLVALRSRLTDAESLSQSKACVYLTGSFGRGEASERSDLDLFIAGHGTREKPALGRLDEICVKANLIQAVRYFNFPDFSGDGEPRRCYLHGQMYAYRAIGVAERSIELQSIGFQTGFTPRTL